MPWISLDFLVKIETYQWVTRDFREMNFARASSPRLTVAAPGACGRGHAEAQDCSWGKLNSISDYPQ